MTTMIISDDMPRLSGPPKGNMRLRLERGLDNFNTPGCRLQSLVDVPYRTIQNGMERYNCPTVFSSQGSYVCQILPLRPS